MADSTIPDLTAITTPASTDEFAVHQSGDTRAKKQTRAELHALETGEHFILPQELDATTPSLAFGDGDSGFYENSDDVIHLALGGSARMAWTTTTIGATNTALWGLDQGAAASDTNPNFLPRGSDADTGIGSVAADAVSIIAGGVEAIRVTEATSILQAVEADVGLTAATDSIQGTGVLLSSYNVVSVVAVDGDAVTLPGAFQVGTLVYIKNDDAGQFLDVFPASGDDAGGGTDTAVAITEGDFAVFMGTSASATWTKIMGGTA